MICCNFTNFYKKKVFVKTYDKKTYYGVLERISYCNNNKTVMLKYLGTSEKHSITTNLIDKIYYDNSINLLGKILLVKDKLVNKLNLDCFNYLKLFLNNEIIYLKY